MKKAIFLFICVALISPISRALPITTFAECQRQSSPIKLTSSGDGPFVTLAVHNVGKIQISLTNIGQFGAGGLASMTPGYFVPDPLTGLGAPYCTYPANSNIDYLMVGGIWVGAIVDGDTLVSVAAEDAGMPSEFWPDKYPVGNFGMKSILTSSNFFSEDAISEQDFVARYCDTLVDPRRYIPDMVEGRPHYPMNLKVTQKSYAWSSDYVDDFIIIEYRLKNIGRETMEKAYFGVACGAIDFRAGACAGR